jgi:hypothetical protein
MTQVDCKKDKEINQKFCLFSFVAKEDKRVSKDETVGIIIHGAYDTEEAMDAHAKQLHDDGFIYFNMMPEEIGKWLEFPDMTSSKPTKAKFLNDSISTEFGNETDLNKMTSAIEENVEKKKNVLEDIEKNIYRFTYLERPESKENTLELIGSIISAITNNTKDITFYSDVMTLNLNKIKNEEYEADIENMDYSRFDEKYDESVDYINLLSHRENDEFCVFSYTDENSTRQKSNNFMFKARGIYNNGVAFDARAQDVFKEDPLFDIFKVKVGVWNAFNPYKSSLEANSDLNKLLYYKLEEFKENKKEFEDRIKSAKEKKEIEEVKFTRGEIQNNIDSAKSSLTKAQTGLQKNIEMLKINSVVFHKEFDRLDKDAEEYTDLYNGMVKLELPEDIINDIFI